MSGRKVDVSKTTERRGCLARTIDVCSNNEWDPLTSVIVGTVEGAQIPQVKDCGLHAIDYPAHTAKEFEAAPCGPYPTQVLEETAEDLEAFCDQLTHLGIEVRRPGVLDFSEQQCNGLWKVDGYHSFCPRDTIVAIGTRVFAAPMVLRQRQHEARAYRKLFNDDSWIQCPLPMLSDAMYDRSRPSEGTLRNIEPAFDAANLLRFNRDILYLVSNTGNRLGARLLQELLGDEYRVHTVANVYQDRHIDTTFMPLREGLLLCNPSRVREDDIPEFLTDWDIAWSAPMEPLPSLSAWCAASEWIGMNVLSLGPTLVAVEEHQIALMRQLNRLGIETLPVKLRHCRTLGGGPHCVTVDLQRQTAATG